MLGVIAERLATRGLLILAKPRLSEANLRTLRAFAEAMAPGTHGMPPAAGPDGPARGRGRRRRSARRVPGLAAARARLADPARAALVRVGAVPVAVQPRQPRGAPGLPAKARRDERAARGPAAAAQGPDRLRATPTTPAFARAVGSEATCRVAGDAARPAAAHPLGDLEPRGDGEDCDVAIVGSGAGGAVAAAVLAEAGLDVLVLEAGPYLNRDTYPQEPFEALRALYRDGGLDRRRGAARDPDPGRPRRRRDDGDQLRHLLPRPRRAALALEHRERRHLGERARRRLRGGRADAPREAGRPRADGPKRADPPRGGRGARPLPPSARPQRRRLRHLQLVPVRLPARREARDARLLPAAGGRRGRARPRRRRRPARSSSRATAPSGSAAAAASRPTPAARAAPTRSARAGP